MPFISLLLIFRKTNPMSDTKTIKSALISVYNKEGLSPIVKKLHALGVTIYSTGGTEKFINNLGIEVIPVEKITAYPSILGGRVKTLHPKVFGGILNRQDHEDDQSEMHTYTIPQIDAVIVDLYPFEDTVASGASHSEIIEKIDIGGISLIRAAAKNYEDVICVSSMQDYEEFFSLIKENSGKTEKKDRQYFATKAFHISSHYDSAIFNYFNADNKQQSLKISASNSSILRYGENPHQKGVFFGNLENLIQKLHGKELSYNNLLDVDAAVHLMSEFVGEMPTFAILKHNNACGVAQRETLASAYQDALAGDPISAFGGVLICNTSLDEATAVLVHKLFCEVVIAPDYNDEALAILKEKKNRIILKQIHSDLPQTSIRSCLNGILQQDKDNITDKKDMLQNATVAKPSASQIEDLLFASKICKHTKSNTIVLAKNKQLCASGTGQTSRVDALNQAIHKANSFDFNLEGAVMASDAFFPFPDCVEIAHDAGIQAVIQPGGSIKDQLSIDFCNSKNVAMVFSKIRHFKH